MIQCYRLTYQLISKTIAVLASGVRMSLSEAKQMTAQQFERMAMGS